MQDTIGIDLEEVLKEARRLVASGSLQGGQIVSICGDPFQQRGIYRSSIAKAEVIQKDIGEGEEWVLYITCSKTFRHKGLSLEPVGDLQRYSLPLKHGLLSDISNGNMFITQCKYATTCMLIPNTNREELIVLD